MVWKLYKAVEEFLCLHAEALAKVWDGLLFFMAAVLRRTLVRSVCYGNISM